MTLRSGKFSNSDFNLNARLKDPSSNCYSSLKDPDLTKKIQIQPNRDSDPKQGFETIVDTFLRYTNVKIKFLFHCGKSDAVFTANCRNLPLDIVIYQFHITVVPLKVQCHEMVVEMWSWCTRIGSQTLFSV
jgi:hypothetical protein